MVEHLTAKRGDDVQWTAALTVDDAAYDLSGCTLWWRLKRNAGDADDDALVTAYWVDGGASDGITVDAPAAGVVEIRVPAADAAGWGVGVTYRWGLRLLDAAGAIVEISAGTLAVQRDIAGDDPTP